MRIGILETGEVAEDLRARHGDYPAMFRELLSAVDPALEFATIRVVAGEMPAAPSQADAWIVTGSRHGVYDGLPWIEPLKAFLRDCVASRVPVVGICFGHQILAEALGGRAAKSDRGWGLGVQDYAFVARPGWMADAPAHFAMRAVHQDQVTTLPPGATLLATSPFCEYAALAYGDPEAPDAISLQPHPEFGPEFMSELLALRAGRGFPMADYEAAKPGLDRPVASADWARWIVAYLREAEAGRAAA
ncbi:type 1 glutamine amidotransferase [Amaricoccus solimangrovi]|uniref:Type 1 glutamine amidotransferase n=1 Tax=Amaricoccus solimangrovi TaxID=2589815 RepID=A0A501WFV3_9RHOB|nr:gamma-glutamyl-gamma-aminobutyrate hydrolase family protein [Amaricoccus solimangrovi]TPE48288.1 type 1 glutamine amidotransferase [Amaricoccus solimangrovi]